MKVDKFNETHEEIIHIEGNDVSNDSVPITNNRDILTYMVNIQTDAFKSHKLVLTSNLIEPLTKIFGTQNKTMRLEFMTKLWVLKFKDLTFNVYTAKNRGTSYEVCDYSYEDIRTDKLLTKKIIEFLDELYKLINE